jgi:hypothetical protein
MYWSTGALVYCIAVRRCCIVLHDAAWSGHTIRFMGRAALPLVASCLLLGGCTSGEESAQPTTTAKTQISDAAVETFAGWYRAATMESDWEIPEELREETAGSRAAMVRLIAKLCALDHSDTPAPADRVKDDPALFGNAAFAAAVIVTARTACGLKR